MLKNKPEKERSGINNAWIKYASVLLKNRGCSKLTKKDYIINSETRDVTKIFFYIIRYIINR